MGTSSQTLQEWRKVHVRNAPHLCTGHTATNTSSMQFYSEVYCLVGLLASTKKLNEGLTKLLDVGQRLSSFWGVNTSCTESYFSCCNMTNIEQRKISSLDIT